MAAQVESVEESPDEKAESKEKAKARRDRKRMLEDSALVARVIEAMEIPSQLMDMRHVYEHAEEHDTTPGQKAMRKWLADKPESFHQRMSRLEEAWLESRPGSGKEPTGAGKEADGGPDLGTARCRGMIEKLIREWGDAGTAASEVAGGELEAGDDV